MIPRRSQAASEKSRLGLDDLAAAVWVQAFDAAWLSQDWQALGRYFAQDVLVMETGFSTPVTGRPAVLEYFRSMMNGTQVHEYNATDLKGHSSGETGVIYYRWQLDWTVDNERRAQTGRDVLVLRSLPEGWQLVWRAQIRS